MRYNGPWKGLTDYNRAYWNNKSAYFRDATCYLKQLGIQVVSLDGHNDPGWVDLDGFKIVSDNIVADDPQQMVQHEKSEDKFQHEIVCRNFKVTPSLLDPIALKNFLHPAFLQAESLVPLLNQRIPGVFSIPVFRPELCELLRGEVQRMSKECELTLNNDGLHLGYFGLTPLLENLVKTFSDKLVSKVHPDAELTLKSAFVVFYQPGDRHVTHDDESDLKIHINLGVPGFIGGDLLVDYGNPVEDYHFLGGSGRGDYDAFYPPHRRLERMNIRTVAHTYGGALIHAGNLKHGAEPLVSGQRMNLILWMDCPPKFHFFPMLPFSMQYEVFSHVELMDLQRMLCVSKSFNTMFASTEMWWLFKTRNGRFIDITQTNGCFREYLGHLSREADSYVVAKIRAHYIADSLMTHFSKYSVQEVSEMKTRESIFSSCLLIQRNKIVVWSSFFEGSSMGEDKKNYVTSVICWLVLRAKKEKLSLPP